ncbi:MAG: hypothetical protein AAB355_02615 [Patescibacteria group bacterium]
MPFGDVKDGERVPAACNSRRLFVCQKNLIVIRFVAIMNVNVEVRKSGNENALGLLRRFTRRVQESGVLPRVRSMRYSDRPLSKFKRKKGALKVIGRRKEYERLRKLGKLPQTKKGRRR